MARALVLLALLPVVTAVNQTTTKRKVCETPVDGCDTWYYNAYDDGPHTCIPQPDGSFRQWVMLNAYRSGGERNLHWRYYTPDKGAEDCLREWKYYAKDGVTLIANVTDFFTEIGGKGSWCAKDVYRSGGVEGKQWAYCKIYEREPKELDKMMR